MLNGRESGIACSLFHHVCCPYDAQIRNSGCRVVLRISSDPATTLSFCAIKGGVHPPNVEECFSLWRLKKDNKGPTNKQADRKARGSFKSSVKPRVQFNRSTENDIACCGPYSVVHHVGLSDARVCLSSATRLHFLRWGLTPANSNFFGYLYVKYMFGQVTGTVKV
jgi:hypothetical protein